MKEEKSALAKITGLLGGLAGRVIVAALLILLTFEGLRFCFDFGHAIFYQQPVEAAPGTDHVVTLQEDDTMQSVAQDLKEEGLIRNETAFIIQGQLYQINLFPGEYTLNTSMTTKEILEALNTDPEEYAAQVKESEAERQDAAEETEAAVIGGGDELVDAEQAAAAAEGGIQVETEAVSTEAASETGAPEGETGAEAGAGA